MTVVAHRRVYSKLPHPKWRVPLLGDLLSYDVDVPAQSALKIAAQLGPIYELRAFGVRYVVAAGADVVADLNDETRFCKHIGPDIEALRMLGGDGLFTAYNDEPTWQQAHDLLMPAFSQAAMRRYHSTMLDIAEELTGNWDAHADAETTVDVSVDTTRVTLETIGLCAAGYSFGCFQSDNVHPFVEHMVSGLKGADRAGVLRASRLARGRADARCAHPPVRPCRRPGLSTADRGTTYHDAQGFPARPTASMNQPRLAVARSATTRRKSRRHRRR
jgi:cytochrome P450